MGAPVPRDKLQERPRGDRSEPLPRRTPWRTRIGVAYLVPGLGSGEGLIEYLKANEADPRALVFETEFGPLLTAMSREGSTLSPIIRNAWDGVPLGRHVASQKASGTVLDHHVGVLANITGIELAQKLTSVEAANGFGNRFLWLGVRRPHLLPFTEPDTAHVSPLVGVPAIGN